MEEHGDAAARAVAHAVRVGAAYADARHQVEATLEVERKERATRRVSAGLESGVGVRVLVRAPGRAGRDEEGAGGWGFFAWNEATAASWKAGVAAAVRAARAVARQASSAVGLGAVPARRARVAWTPRRPPADVPLEDKADLLARMDDAARAEPAVRSVTGSYSEGVRWQRFASSEGAEVTTEVTRTFASVTLTAKDGARLASRKARLGGTGGFEVTAPADERVEEARAAVVRLLRAKKAPGGRMTVVADPELVGVFAHEAVGHACEADLVLANDSVLRGRLGEDLGSPLVTIRDDPTLPGRFGSFPFDDEGVEAKPRTLVERGVLRGYLTDRATAATLGVPANGAARADDYGSRPLVRMSNTFVANGDRAFEELLEGVRRGIYAKGSRGGQVDTAKGTFAFSAQEAFLVENGRLTAPLRDVGLTGFILETLRSVDAVGNDLALRDPGFCGKGQYVPVGDGGPHVRIRDVVVGGGDA